MGLCCSKSCAASKREKSKPGYNEQRVKRNNRRRILWNDAPYMSVGRAILAGATFDDGYDPFGDAPVINRVMQVIAGTGT